MNPGQEITMAIEIEDIFKKCAPAVRTNIERCGTVSVCASTVPTTVDELETLYKSNGDYRILESLFMTQMETRACGVVQNSWEDFFLANMKTVKKGELQLDSNERSLMKIRPFLLGKSKKPINNVYWRFDGGQSAGGGNWQIDVYSTSGIPAETRFFAVGERVFTESRNNSTKNWWNGVIVSATLVSGTPDKVRLVVTPQNAGSAFDSVASPVAGILKRGTANIAKTEAFCDNEPAMRNDTRQPYWIEHNKYTFCKTQDFDEFRKFVLANNPLYRELEDIPEVEEIKQRGQAFWSKWFNALMFGKPISANQNLTDYTSLDPVNYFVSGTTLGFPGTGTRCSGFKANTVGWMEQLQQCGRIYDAAGADLDLWSLMDAIYVMARVRMGVGSAAATQFDLFCDSSTAEIIDRAFILLFKEVSADTMRLTQDINRGRNEAFGFQYSSYRLRGKCQGITLNVITHYGLDDYLAEWTAFEATALDGHTNASDSGRVLWMLDMTGMYAKIIETSNKTTTTGKLDDLAAVDSSFQCVEETITREVTQRGVTFAAVVECPAADLIIYNFSGEVPEHVISDERPSYLPSAADEAVY
jgi:hypothetical protein